MYIHNVMCVVDIYISICMQDLYVLLLERPCDQVATGDFGHLWVLVRELG